jgi:hypothetical protein
MKTKQLSVHILVIRSFFLLPILILLLLLSSEIIAAESGFRVFTDNNGKIVASSMESGSILFSGSDAADVINAAIRSIPENHGGEIKISAGEYLLTKSILIDRHGITLSGEGRKSGCYGGPPYIKSNSDIDMVVIRKDGIRLRGVTIRDISFFGSGISNGKAGIHAIGCSDVLVIQNVGVYNTETGILLQGGPAGAVDAAELQFVDPQQCGRGLVLEYCHYTKVLGGEFSDNTCTSLPSNMQAGIYLTNNQFGKTIGVKIIGITAVRNSGSGIIVGKGSYDISIMSGCDLGGNGNNGLLITDEESGKPDDIPESININGLIIYNNKFAGIKADKVNHLLISSCITSVNQHPYVGNNGQDYGIFISGDSKNVMINGNMAYDNKIKQIADESGKAMINNNF